MFSFLVATPHIVRRQPTAQLVQRVRTFRQKLQRYVLVWLAFSMVTASVSAFLRTVIA